MKRYTIEMIRPSPRDLWWRRTCIKLWRGPYGPAHVQVVADAIKRAEALSAQGWGILMPFTHFSFRDIVEISIRPMALSKYLITKPCVATIEWAHFYDMPIGRLLTNLTGITLVPIVIDDTMKKGKNYDENHRMLPLGHGTRDYFRVARKVLKEGGVVWVAPQQGRRPCLELSDKEPIKFVLGKENELQNVGVMFISLSLKGETDYTKRKGFNVGRTYDVKLGPTLTKAELYQLSRAMGKTIDETTMVIYSYLVDPGYSNVKSDWSWEDIMKSVGLPVAPAPNQSAS